MPQLLNKHLLFIVALAHVIQFAQPTELEEGNSLVEVIDRAANRIRLEIGKDFEEISNNLLGGDEHEKATNQLKSSGFNPVLFIPGDGGSQLEAKLTQKPTVPHFICSKDSDWYDLWLNIHLLTPLAFDCLIDNMLLHYNKTDRLTYNTQGVEIRPTNFGALSSVTWLDLYHIYKTDYFDEIVTTLEKNNGLVRELHMIGAAFDFRKAPNELAEFFQNLTLLIERHYVMNNYRPVTLICHSMGCLNSLYLLNNKTENWKSVFVKRLITLGAPWHGSFKAISAMLYGDNLGIPLLAHEKLRTLQSSFPSLMYLFPREPTFRSDRVLVQTPEVNYTLQNFDQLFLAANMSDQLEMWRDTRAIAVSLKAPNVELWCLYGSGAETPEKISYSGPISGGSFQEVYGDGDGTVNLESLQACEGFASEQEKPVYTRMFKGVDHIDILRGSEAANFISTRILAQDLTVVT